MVDTGRFRRFERVTSVDETDRGVLATLHGEHLRVDVVRSDGSIGGYGPAAWGGVAAALELKRALLRLEGVEVG